MNKDKIEKILDKLTEEDFFKSKESGLSQAEIDYLKDNPHLLEELSNTSLIKKRYIFIAFFISLTMSALAKFFQYTHVLAGFEILNDIFTNVLFSIAMEMLGASIVAFMLEIMFEKRVEKNQQIIKQIRKEMEKANTR